MIASAISRLCRRSSPIIPDQMAPIVRAGADGGRELVMARWGMPGPPQYGGAPITNGGASGQHHTEDRRQMGRALSS
jgi:putative SOS response-associated peptidase YedK